MAKFFILRNLCSLLIKILRKAGKYYSNLKNENDVHYLRRIWGDPVFSKVIAAGIIALLVFLSTHFQEMTKVKWMVLGSIGLITFFTFVFWPKKIKWNYDWFLAMSGETIEGKTHIKIFSFQASAINGKSVAISSVKGFVKSNISNEVVPIYLVVEGKIVECSKIQGIPPGASFQITAPFGPVVNGTLSTGRDPESFLSNFGDLTIEIQIDEKIYRKRFREKLIRKIIEQFKTVSAPKKNTIFLKE